MTPRTLDELAPASKAFQDDLVFSSNSPKLCRGKMKAEIRLLPVLYLLGLRHREEPSGAQVGGSQRQRARSTPLQGHEHQSTQQRRRQGGRGMYRGGGQP